MKGGFLKFKDGEWHITHTDTKSDCHKYEKAEKVVVDMLFPHELRDLGEFWKHFNVKQWTFSKDNWSKINTYLAQACHYRAED
jgi:hypothetical protein